MRTLGRWSVFSVALATVSLLLGLLGVVSSSASDSSWTQAGGSLSGSAPGDHFGSAIAISDDGLRLAVGAFINGGNGQQSGHVRVFDWSGSGWVQAGPAIEGESIGDRSGLAVSMSSDGVRLAIGAPSNDDNGVTSGHVRVFDWSGSTWVQAGSDLDGEAMFDNFGESVSLSSDGTRLAVGAGGNNGTTGHARVFGWSGSNWIQIGSDIEGDESSDYFGRSVSLSSDGSRLAVGAPFNDDAALAAGRVKVFDWSGSAWVQVGADIDGENQLDTAGWEVSLSADGSRVAIGSPRSDANGSSSGQVRVFDWSGSAWVQAGLGISGEASGDSAGSQRMVSLSSDGNRLAIGARGNDGNGADSGHVRVFDWSGSTWVQTGADIDGQVAGDSDPAIGAAGGSVALSGDGLHVAIGAVANDSNGIDSGHARVFTVSGGCAGRTVTIDLNVPGTPAVGTSGNDVILGTPGPDVIDALGGDDTVCAGAGDDLVVGGDGDDALFGGSGDDVMRGNAGADELDGGDGDDRLLGGVDGDTLTGGPGEDYLGGFGGNDLIEGGMDADTVFGGFGADVIDGGPGDDELHGLVGNDTIDGGDGADTITGDRGNDTINGGNGDDVIRGGNANDIVNGDAGNDEVSGGRADDTLSGGAGTDTCAGNDQTVADTADFSCETIFGIP